MSEINNNYGEITPKKKSSTVPRNSSKNEAITKSTAQMLDKGDCSTPHKLKPLGKSKKKSHKKKKSKKKVEEKEEIARISKSLSKINISGDALLKNKNRVQKIQQRNITLRSARGLNSIEDVARIIKAGGVKNIIVMAGAGISTASGIPDFRSPGTGLYDNLQKYKVPYPTAVFDLEYFHSNPKPFFELAKELYPSGKYRPNAVHYFVRCLHERGLLLRMYTQNIDGLERLAGIPPMKLVEAHGTFTSASCTKCGKKYNGETIKDKILKGATPRCQLTPLCYGIIKPDIVFFGEDLPKRFYYYLKDFPACDLLLVMGTSLQVEPFASLVDSTRATTPRLLLNMVKVGPFTKPSRRTDLAITGDISDSIHKLADALDWREFLQETMEAHEKLHTDEVKDERVDSGVSSASSSEVRELPPVDTNVKRYFHTIRSTPLPKPTKHGGEESGSGEPAIPTNLSYYDFIKKSTKPSKVLGLYALSKSRPPVIQYTRTMKGKKTVPRTQSVASMPTRRNDESETDSDSDVSTSTDDSGF